MSAKIPPDINLQLPATSTLSVEDMHFLTYIPWSEKYFSLIPPPYLYYFNDILPLLHTRTTDVHVAICFQYFDTLVSACSTELHTSIDRDVVALALILHDVGWSQLSDSEIASSLGVKGVRLNASALAPKEKHALESEKITLKYLQKWVIPQEKSHLICKCVRWHDHPEKVSQNGRLAPEIAVLVDLDHLWTFTHLNFWQDTVRKGVPSAEYAGNLADDLDSYFVSDSGKALARKLLSDRQTEITDLS